MIQALFIDPRGPYPTLLGRENCWDAERDASGYAGPDPVVAHPPCGPWSKQRRNYKGAEHDLAPRALEQVRQFGGVLEHPAGSRLFEWDAYEGPEVPPPKPGEEPDQWGGYTIAVQQVEWGHVCRKPTWLYVVGVPREIVESAIALRPYPGRKPTHWASGGRTKSSRQGSPVPPGIKVCSAQQRRRTPEAFARLLIAIARSARL